MNAEAHEFMQLRVGLRKALFNNELELFYQPRLHLKRGSIVGIEALMRWNHPKLGLINPSKFIPIAEETGLIFEIGDWALREACKINKKWQDKGQGHLTMSVNLSSKQFFHPLIDETIAKILRETELNPKYLELEITERDIMEDVAQATIILNKLKNIGVQIAIDHFGSGYTSISYLKQFPVNVIKIDPGFIKGVQINPNDSAITSAIIALVHNLGLEVIAEGVETAEQVLFLGNHNCDMVQGYYLSHPLPAHKIILQFKNLMDNVMI
jgi:EAL domain-containing protein (putative c-di-GMP-specific phosphodiesterase class I)